MSWNKSVNGNNKYILGTCYDEGTMLDTKELSTSIKDVILTVGETDF